MAAYVSTHFNLPWHQHDQYWIGVFAKSGSMSAAAKTALSAVGMTAEGAGGYVVPTGQDWKTQWDAIYSAIQKAGCVSELQVVLTHGTAPVTGGDLDRKTPEKLDELAQSMWLGHALLNNQVVCYLQPIMDTNDKVFGYESFARVRQDDGSVLAGDKIMAASRALNIEFMIDRHLQVEAVRTFISSDFEGFLFVNFFLGFIQRPQKYLQGLHDTAKTMGIVAKHIVLEVTQAEAARDINHVRDICEYGRSCGYSIALDDIESLDGVQKLVPAIRPDFLKIDMSLCRMVAEPSSRETIRHIVELVHSAGGAVIAEGVETEDMRERLRQLGVDLFQGYLFAPPQPVEKVLGRKAV